MCKPDDEQKTKHVVICGGGPGGVMTALCLLGRNNDDDDSPKYRVTLVDNRENYANVKKSDLSLHRSWMIGLSTHGIDSVHSIPGLWDEYVNDVGILVKHFSVHLGEKELKFDGDDLGSDNFIVDRNHMVWALTNSLFDRYGKKNNIFAPLYNTKCLYVDGEKKRILIRSSKTENNDKKEKEYYLDYDVLIGADGFRSVVRSAFVRSERFFECSMSDIFNRFKAIHVDLPEGYHPASFHLLPDCMPNMNGIGLPEKEQKINIGVGYYRHKECHPDLKSDDVDVVANYFKEHFKACKFVDYKDAASQWVNQSWNSTGQVTCNFYHSTKMSALMLGDAVHATSPSIGMGMNTALADAVALNQLLDTHKDNWNEVLPAFSKLRVKEGRSLTALAYYLFSMKPNQSLYYLIRGTIVNYIHMWLPSFISQHFIEDPQALIGRGHLLSQVYNDATKLGVLSAIRKTNDTIRREWEEKEYGMIVADEKNNQSLLMGIMFLVAVAAVAIAWMYPPLLNEQVSSLGKILQFMKQQ